MGWTNHERTCWIKSKNNSNLKYNNDEDKKRKAQKMCHKTKT